MSEHDGIQGVQGIQGAQGSPGVRGAAGVQGVQGVQGNTDSLALEVGKVMGAVKVIANEVTAMRGDLTGVSAQLATGGMVMAKLESRLEDVHRQVKLTNGRTTELEVAVEGIRNRWRDATSVSSLLNKIATGRVVGYLLAAVASAAAGAYFS